jgi:hypothetical protein
MFHNNTNRLIEDWNARRCGRATPARSDISPAAFRELLPQVFMLGSEPDRTEPFRLAGALLGDLHGRELRGECFYALWMPSDRQRVHDALAQARADGAPVVLAASGWTAEGDEAKLEIVLAPLTGPSGEMDRVLGLYQPTSSLRRLLGQPLVALTLNHTRLAGQEAPASRPRLRLVALDGRRLD